MTPVEECELADARNVTGIATALGDGPTDLPGCIITVPACTWPVWLEYGARLEQEAADNAAAALHVIDVTDAMSANLLTSCMQVLPAALDGTTHVVDLHGRFRLGPVPEERRLKLQLACGHTAQSDNRLRAANSPPGPSYLTALRR